MNAMCTTERAHYRYVMPLWRLRDFDDDDLDQAIQIWDQSRTPGSAEPVFAVAEVMAAARAGQPAVVAEVGDEVVGMAVARTDGERAGVLLVALASRWGNRGIGSARLGCGKSALSFRRAHPARRRWKTLATPVVTGWSTTR